MASTSVASAVARATDLNYADLEEMKRVKIPKEEQKVVTDEMNKEKHSPTPGTDSEESLREMFNAATPMKCVRIPKREQRYVEMAVEEANK